MTYQYDHAVFIGRFQGFHAGHNIVIQKAFEVAQNVIIVLGSHNCARTLDNPFTSKEREIVIRSVLTPEQLERVSFVAVEDHGYSNNSWLAEAQAAIETAIFQRFTPNPVKVALIGHEKDGTSYYLKMFPEFDNIDVPNESLLSATDLREMMYEGDTDWMHSNYIINEAHMNALIDLYHTDWFEALIDEWEWIEDYKEEWGPRKPVKKMSGITYEIGTVKALTTDAAVTVGGYILLIQRGGFPGKGQWALPGGFLNDWEPMIDGMIRELREETKLKIPEPVLRGSIKRELIADNPYRDPRGRIVTRAFHIDIQNYGGGGDDISLPVVKGSDDAKVAKWFKLGALPKMRTQMFADHYDIIEYLIGGF